MKQQLSEENVNALVSYRLSRAKETLAEVPHLRDMGYFNTAVNRLFYACYYAMVALLIKNHIQASTHAGVKQKLGLHFVSKGLISKESNRSFSLLFERRHSSDYDDFAYATCEEVDELLPKAKSFISEIEALL